jgi:hypothetical protein
MGPNCSHGAPIYSKGPVISLSFFRSGTTVRSDSWIYILKASDRAKSEQFLNAPRIYSAPLDIPASVITSAMPSEVTVRMQSQELWHRTQRARELNRKTLGAYFNEGKFDARGLYEDLIPLSEQFLAKNGFNLSWRVSDGVSIQISTLLENLLEQMLSAWHSDPRFKSVFAERFRRDGLSVSGQKLFGKGGVSRTLEGGAHAYEYVQSSAILIASVLAVEIERYGLWKIQGSLTLRELLEDLGEFRATAVPPSASLARFQADETELASYVTALNEMLPDPAKLDLAKTQFTVLPVLEEQGRSFIGSAKGGPWRKHYINKNPNTVVIVPLDFEEEFALSSAGPILDFSEQPHGYPLASSRWIFAVSSDADTSAMKAPEIFFPIRPKFPSRPELVLPQGVTPAGQ